MATMTTEMMFGELDAELSRDYVSEIWTALDLDLTWICQTNTAKKTHDREVAEVMTEQQEDYFPGCRMVVEVFQGGEE